MNTPQPAQHPNITSLKAQLRSKNVLFGDVMSRICAVAQDTEAPGGPTCTGNLTIGMFFDGTGNNETADHGGLGSPIPLRQRKHSNVVRLYHAFPDESRLRQRESTNKSYRFYIPGVGTPFPEIGDKGRTIGSAAAWGGEPRILWGLTRILNAVHMFYRPTGLINDQQANSLVNNLAYDTPAQLKDYLDYLSWPKEWINNMRQHHERRRATFGGLVQQLKAAIPPNANPRIRRINLSVFGFSRGSAEARAFVNWLLELCEGKTGQRTLAGIPLEIQFMGLFDTVASVGLAGLYSFIEGRQGWAENNLQIPSADVPIRHCVHMVAAHEVRACFPLDSARNDYVYPPNTTEIIYPGAHSDLGGGYLPQALGKDDWKADASHHDLQLARAPCFDMYCRAMAAGVPFYTLEQLAAQKQLEVAQALLPSGGTLDDIARYLQQANVPAGPVEDMARAHMQYYHAWRWKLGVSGFSSSPEFQRIKAKPNRGKDYEQEEIWVRSTQYALLQVITAYCNEIDRRMRDFEGGRVPLNNTLRPLQSEMEKGIARMTMFFSILPLSPPFFGVTVGGPALYQQRRKWLQDADLIAKAQQVSREAKNKLAQWRQWLQNNFHPEWHDLDAEREGIWLLESVLKAEQVSDDMASFFGRHVHDSMAGFIGFGMPEFEANGYGLGKYRRTFFGDHGDKVLRDRVKSENEARGNEAGEAAWKNNQRTLPPVINGPIFPRW